MPEGDTIHKVAARMRPLLVGARLVAARARGDHALPDLVGRVVRSVDARGKHLLIAVEGGPTLRVHLGLRGSWHRYSPGAPWARRPGGATLVLETATDVFVAFGAQRIEWLTAGASTSRALGRLGPDLLAPDVTPRDVLPRARERSHLPLGELLLDQTVAAGVGNVYKSEVLFLEGHDPWTPAAALDDARLLALFDRAQRLLRANVATPSRVTRGHDGDAAPRPGEPRYYVYGRGGEPCLRCRTTILFRRQGEQNRSSYWCPTCQPARRPEEA